MLPIISSIWKIGSLSLIFLFLFVKLKGSDEEKEAKKDDYKMYLKLMERDKKKFKAADIDADGKLSKLGKIDFYLLVFFFLRFNYLLNIFEFI